MKSITAPYKDPAQPVEVRVADLLARMTRAEKLAQLGAIWAFQMVADGQVDPERVAALAPDGIGEITRLAGSTNLRPVDVARAHNEIQRYLVEDTRLGIPGVVHEECLHGLMAWDAPCFQQSIGAAATFDPAVVGQVAATIRQRMLLTGARHALAPVFDIASDPRWGRIEETYGEDPYLAAEMGHAYTVALQGDSLDVGVVATAKHLIGHGLAEGGLNQAPAHIGPRQLRDEQLFPFEVAVRHSGIGSVMPAYGDVDGVPCHASVELLTTILRDEWGFDGVVASDYTGVAMLATHHRMTTEASTAAVLALRAGVDLELPRTDRFGAPLLAALEDGRVDEALVDRAVVAVLRMKFRLGLFETPYLDIPGPAAIESLIVEEAQAARSLAERSLVLVKNAGILPLRADTSRIAVIGPIADSARDLLGDYSHMGHMETLREMRARDNAFGVSGEAQSVVVIDETTGRRTILQAIVERFATSAVEHAAGGRILDATAAELDEAVEAARSAAVAVVVLGERSGLTSDATTGEFRDRRGLGFIGRQQALLEAVVGTGTPVVLVVVSGRPLAIEWAAEHCAAVLQAWVPGDAGPDAIAAALCGDLNPGGKLPVTVLRDVGQVPLTYRHHPSGGRSNWKVDYVDGTVTPLWPFGFGLSYTAFEVSRLRVDRGDIATDGGAVQVHVDVRNVGAVAGDEVVQLYARDEEASVARPVRELIGFRRVTLQPGETRTVTFDLTSETFAHTAADHRRIVEPGRVHLSAGTSSADLPTSATIDLIGPVHHLRERHHYLTASTVE